MQWKDLPKADTVDVECLGERAPQNDPVAAACYEEVSEFQRKYLAAATSDTNYDWRQAAFSAASEVFDDRQRNRPPAGWLARMLGQDTPATRMNNKLEAYRRDMPVYLDMVDGMLKKYDKDGVR